MWRFFNTGYSSGRANMAFDEMLVHKLDAGDFEGAVRVYGWSPPCISLGYHQVLGIVDVENCRGEGIDIVRRPTGGRAILHWEELTYSVVFRPEGQSLTEAYLHIGLALVRGLQRLNSEICLSRQDLPSLRAARPTTTIPCYASIARFEIQHRGKKLVGSAQRRFRFPRREGLSSLSGCDEVVLQHGSVLLGPAHRRLVEFLAMHEPSDVEALKKELEEKSTELSTILSRKVEFDEVALCIRSGFEEEWGTHFADAVGVREHPVT